MSFVFCQFGLSCNVCPLRTKATYCQSDTQDRWSSGYVLHIMVQSFYMDLVIWFNQQAFGLIFFAVGAVT